MEDKEDRGVYKDKGTGEGRQTSNCKGVEERYGLKKLSKEENMRLKKRTEEIMEISQAKANYWKWHQEDGRAKRT